MKYKSITEWAEKEDDADGTYWREYMLIAIGAALSIAFAYGAVFHGFGSQQIR